MYSGYINIYSDRSSLVCFPAFLSLRQQPDICCYAISERAEDSRNGRGGSVNTASVWVCDAKQWRGRRRRGGCAGRSGGPGDSDECVIMEVRASSGGICCTAALPLLWLCFLQFLWALGVGGEKEAELRQQGASD